MALNINLLIKIIITKKHQNIRYYVLVDESR